MLVHAGTLFPFSVSADKTAQASYKFLQAFKKYQVSW